jgi:thioredoxin 1
MSRIISINSSDFQNKILGSDKPIILEFYSHGCPHCKAFKDVYQHLSDVMGDSVDFARIDVLASEENRQLAVSRGVRGVPTMEMFYRGRVICNVVGNHPFDKMVEILEESLSEKDENIAPHTLLYDLPTVKSK